jgi:hypothetical protein
MEVARYLVELEQPADGWGGLTAMVASAREVAAAMHAGGLPVRFLRSIVVPEDGTCYLLYEASSAEVAQAAAERAAATVRRVAHAPRAGGLAP